MLLNFSIIDSIVTATGVVRRVLGGRRDRGRGRIGRGRRGRGCEGRRGLWERLQSRSISRSRKSVARAGKQMPVWD